MSYLKSLGTSFVYIAFFLAIITFLPGLPPNTPFTEFSIKPPVALTGVLGPNDLLNDPEILFQGQLVGPESFESYNGELYTGIHGGAVVRVLDKKIVPLVRFGKNCAGLWEEEKCGRPLGLKFDKRGVLYVADTYYGIFKVNVETAKYEQLFDPSQPIDGKVPILFNSIDIASNGDVYWTDSSTDYKLYDGLFSILADPAGRLIRYNAATKKNEVLLKNLGFANGLKLSDDESYLLVVETMRSVVWKYHLKGSKSGKSEVLFEGLPGTPDNIHSDGLGNYLLSIIVPSDQEHPQLTQTLIPHPYLRKMISRLLALVELPFKLLDDLYPNDVAKRVVHAIGSLESVSFVFPNNVTVLRINGDGQILNALYNSDEKISRISSAFVHDDYLWLGSPYNDYIARVPIKKAFPNVHFATRAKNHAKITREEPPKVVKHVESPKPTTTTQKPTTTTTTPRPTTTTQKPTTTTTPRPTTTTQKPTTTTTPRPTTTTQKPTTTTPRPTTTTQKPKATTTTTPRPTTTTQKPTQAPPKPVKVKQVEPTPEIHVQQHAQQPPSQEFSREVFDEPMEPPRREEWREETDELPRPIEVVDQDVPASHQAENFRETEQVRHDVHHHDEM